MTTVKLYRNAKNHIWSDDQIWAAHESTDGFDFVGTFGPLIPWDGGDCPLPPDTQIIAYFRNRRPYVGQAIWPDMPESAKPFMWHHAPSGPRTDPAADIVAYRIKLD
jgi:hypothetical protein